MNEVHASPSGADGLMKPHRGAMVLVFGLLGIIPCCISVVFGIVAWAMGSKDLREMRGGFMDPAGQGLTSAGRVLGIVGLAVNAIALVLYVWVGATVGVKVVDALHDMDEIGAALERYHEVHGRYPERLELLLEGDAGHGEPYLNALPKDPWGEPYHYERKGDEGFLLKSASLDRKLDTPDDLPWPGETRRARSR